LTFIQFNSGENGCGIYSSIDYPTSKKICWHLWVKAFGLTGGVISDSSLSKQIAENEVLCRAWNESHFSQTIPDTNQIYIRHIKN
jgi:hypothetical protein